jgi:hypothetical protein
MHQFISINLIYHILKSLNKRRETFSSVLSLKICLFPLASQNQGTYRNKVNPRKNLEEIIYLSIKHVIS